MFSGHGLLPSDGQSTLPRHEGFACTVHDLNLHPVDNMADYILRKLTWFCYGKQTTLATFNRKDLTYHVR